MKILNINRRERGQVEVALPFETDEQVEAAWGYLVANRLFFDFSYRPRSEGEDADRSYIDAYLQRLRTGDPLPEPDAEQIRRIVPKICGAEMNFDIRELLWMAA